MTVWTVFVILNWILASVVGLVGGGYLLYAALQDRLRQKRVERIINGRYREIIGIFVRMGLIRTYSSALFLLAGILGLADPEPVAVLTGVVSTVFISVTAAFTVRDVVARERIFRA